MTLHATLAIGAPMVWTRTEGTGSVQASPTSRVPTLLTRGVWVSGPMPAWRVPAGREQRADDVDVLVLGRRVQRGVGRGHLVEHVDPEEPTACRCWGLARRRSRRSPPVRSPPLPPRGSARRHRPRESRGPETRRGWTLAVAALARSSRARTRRRSSRSCPATDTTGVIRMRAAWLIELQVLRGYGRPEACVAHSR